MTENKNTHIGHITRLVSERHFGFIDTEDEQSYFFHFDTKEQIQLKQQGFVKIIHKFCSGDEVEFKIRPSQKDKDKNEAYQLIFVKNEKREKLIEESKKSGKLLGYIKLVDNDNFFIKHILTYVFIPLEISSWETNLDEIYHNRIDKLVAFELTQTKKIDKLKAVLTDRKYIDEYYELQTATTNEKVLKATITGKNHQGLFATVLNRRIDCFIPISKNPNGEEIFKFDKLRKGNLANVKIKYVYNNRKVNLTLIDNE